MIITLNDKELWNKTFLELPINLQDVYYSSNYYKVYQDNSNALACCFIFKNQDNTFFYPFLKTAINKDYINSNQTYFDIEGAYGYNGPLSTTSNEIFLQQASDLFLEMCLKENIIAEFTRFNPVIKNHVWLKHANIIKANQNVILDLSIGDIWMQAYEHSTRKNINKAERNGLTVHSVLGKNISEEEMQAFLDIYYDTMKRNNAGDGYFFSEKYFKGIAQNVKVSLFVFTSFENKVVSCELILLGSQIGYSFLGGTLAKYFNLRANDILKHNAILKLKEMGLQYYCLGGGTSIDDGIFKYKKCFAKNGIEDFYIGKKIHNQEVYNTVVEKWSNLFPEKVETYKHHLLKYKN